MKRAPLFIAVLSLFLTTYGQRKIESSSDILQEIRKLNVVGNVLYLAAHPDDENTRLIAWLENEKLLRTAYLSLTRGDGGQNLVGTEKGDAMGVLRTQELLEARKIDGAEQFFSRAVDFGYSKTATETFEKWNKDKVLSDVVWVIRKFRPDVIVTRFPPDKRAGHGHHTASAMLAEEAFKLAADKNAFPEQLNKVSVWQTKRLLWNTSVWWDNQLPEKAAKSHEYIKINIGEYNSTLGLSYSEIAADSRSQHKSQGFGSARSRGNKLEYLKHTLGEKAENDLFEGIDLSWNRVKGSDLIQKKLDQIIEAYSPMEVSKSLVPLVELYQLLIEKQDNPYVRQKIDGLKKIILAVGGIHVEVLAEKYSYPSSQINEVNGKFNIVSRSDVPVVLEKVVLSKDSTISKKVLESNDVSTFAFSFELNESSSNPYWLSSLSYDELINTDHTLRARAENKKAFYLPYHLNINGVVIPFETAIDYKWTDRVDGELHRDVVFSPLVTVSPTEKVVVFSSETKQTVELVLESNSNEIQNLVKLKLPEGWKSSPEEIPFELKSEGEQKTIRFELIPPAFSSVGNVEVLFGKKRAEAVQKIDYPHVKPQVLFPTAKFKVVKMKVENTVKNIGYIIGSGDEVASGLRQVGLSVTEINASDLAITDLTQFDAILVGIRAYNTEESMKNGNTILNDFVKKGGTVVVQYNTNRGLKSEKIGPYPFKISRKRVTNEEALPSLLQPKHRLLNFPNKLTKEDFNGWVQERGLYFAGEWSDKYETVISWSDKGEEAQAGALIVADFGEGHFIYTGISFFRQLPAGVPGAYRLLSNLISY